MRTIEPSTYTTTEVARLMHVTEQTVRNWCVAGKIKGAFRNPGGKWLIPKDSASLRAPEPEPKKELTLEQRIDQAMSYSKTWPKNREKYFPKKGAICDLKV